MTARQGMIRDIRQTARRAGVKTPGSGDRAGGVIDPRVLDAMSRVPRHRFVPTSRQGQSYENRPLAIGHGQTISQPYIVALMTDLLGVKPGDRVFELGTGSGYQAAVLAELGCVVYTMEIVEELGRRAEADLKAAGYASVHVRIGDAYDGWPNEAPFDAIIVTAAGDHIPPPLVAQLKPGGRMIMPVGERFLPQQLTQIDKLDDGTVRSRSLLPVAFVPLTGQR